LHWAGECFVRCLATFTYDKVKLLFENYCSSGVCEEQLLEEASMLQHRHVARTTGGGGDLEHSSSSSSSAGCGSALHYCETLCGPDVFHFGHSYFHHGLYDLCRSNCIANWEWDVQPAFDTYCEVGLC